MKCLRLALGLLWLIPVVAVGDEITFNKHVAPIVWKNCAGCHRPGEVAPFSLLSYRDVSKRAEQIQDVTARHIMPPWKPQAGHGEFSNGRRLTADEIGLVKQWATTGAIEGNPADLPRAPTFANGWQMGTPDLIVTLPEAVQVPSDGRDWYLNVVLPLDIPEGKYLKAAEFRPSNRRVVHHAVLFCDTTGKARERDAASAGLGFTAITPPGNMLPGTMAVWVPGRFPLPLPEGLSMPWPKKADLVLNLHLHPSGKPEVEQSSVGFYFTDQPPRRSMLDVSLIDMKIDIPPGEKAFRTQASCVLPIDMDALSVFPHMHLIGKEIKVTATLPDGTARPLLWINDWDFNWQDFYQYATPVRLPQGTKVTLDCVHDNSADNPANPRQPPTRVRWGEQSFDEMSIAFLNLVPVRESDLSRLKSIPNQPIKLVIQSESAKSAPPADVAQRAAEALRKADKNGDGKLSLDEIIAATGNRESAAELEKKVVQFDRDGDKQLNLSEVIEALKSLSK